MCAQNTVKWMEEQANFRFRWTDYKSNGCLSFIPYIKLFGVKVKKKAKISLFCRDISYAIAWAHKD